MRSFLTLLGQCLGLLPILSDRDYPRDYGLGITHYLGFESVDPLLGFLPDVIEIPIGKHPEFASLGLSSASIREAGSRGGAAWITPHARREGHEGAL